MMIISISFCILNYGHTDASIGRCIESIRRQGVPKYEILICSSKRSYNDVVTFNEDEWVRRGKVNKMRNHLCSYASKEFIVLMDGGVELTSNWYSNIRKADCFDLIGSRLLASDNKRVIDWAYPFRLADKHLPLPLQYDEWTNKAYISGILMVIRHDVWEQIKFSEGLLLDEDGEVDFCLRSSEVGFRVGVFPEALAIYHHNLNTYASRKYVTFDDPLRIVEKLKDTFDKREGEKEFKLQNLLPLIKQKLKKMGIG